MLIGKDTKVYVVVRHDNDYAWVDSVFSDKGVAERYCQSKIWRDGKRISFDDYEVEELVIDEDIIPVVLC